MVLYDNYSVITARTATVCWWCFSFSEIKSSDFRQKEKMRASCHLCCMFGLVWSEEQVRMAFLLMVLVRDKCAWYKTCPGLPTWRRRQGFLWLLLSWLTGRWVNWSCELLQCYRAELCTCNCHRSLWHWFSAGDATPLGFFLSESEMWHRDLCFQDTSSALWIKQLSSHISECVLIFKMCIFEKKHPHHLTSATYLWVLP